MNYKINIHDYVSAGTAKLLKAAGYPQDRPGLIVAKRDDMANGDSSEISDVYVKPSLWDAMAWLREKKGIIVLPDIAVWECYMPRFRAKIVGIKEFAEFLKSIKGRAMALKPEPELRTEDRWSYEKACDDGIAMACERLLYAGKREN